MSNTINNTVQAHAELVHVLMSQDFKAEQIPAFIKTVAASHAAVVTILSSKNAEVKDFVKVFTWSHAFLMWVEDRYSIVDVPAELELCHPHMNQDDLMDSIITIYGR